MISSNNKEILQKFKFHQKKLILYNRWKRISLIPRQGFLICIQFESTNIIQDTFRNCMRFRWSLQRFTLICHQTQLFLKWLIIFRDKFPQITTLQIGNLSNSIYAKIDLKPTGLGSMVKNRLMNLLTNVTESQIFKLRGGSSLVFLCKLSINREKNSTANSLTVL